MCDAISEYDFRNFTDKVNERINDRDEEGIRDYTKDRGCTGKLPSFFDSRNSEKPGLCIKMEDILIKKRVAPYQCQQFCGLAAKLFVQEQYAVKDKEHFGTMCCNYIDYSGFVESCTFKEGISKYKLQSRRKTRCRLWGNSRKKIQVGDRPYKKEIWTAVIGSSFSMFFLK